MEDLPLGRIAALVPEFAVKTCPWAEHWWWLSKPVMRKVSKGGVGGVSSFHFQNTLPLSKAVHCIVVVVCWCVSFDNRYRIACLLQSLATVHYYFVLILRVTASTELSDYWRLVVVGEYTLPTSSSIKKTSLGIVGLLTYKVCVPMPTHCTITCFGFHSMWIDGVKCCLFSNHAPLGQTTLRVGRVSV